MSEIIQKFVHIDDNNVGYEIHTDKQIITMLINNHSQCCEDWGVITTEDTLQDFVGARLLRIEFIDVNYDAHPLTEDRAIQDSINGSFEDFEAWFIDIHTSNGKLQFVLYNQHNGYYGHDVSIKSNQINRQANF